MLVSLLLTAALAAQTPPPRPAGSAPAAQTPAVPLPTHAEAAALAEAGNLEASLRAFQQIASANPDDHDARLAIGLLHEEMGHPDRAEPVYRSVLIENPSDIRAMIGVGSTLIARRAYGEAIEVLQQAERADPRNPEVLALLGRAYASSGEELRSLSYLNRAVTANPSAENRRMLERVRFAHGHRIEATGLSEQFDRGISNTQGADVGVNLRVSEGLRVSGRGQWERKFGRRDERGGGGVDWRVRPRTTIVADVLVGPSNRVLPQYEGYLAIDHVNGPADWTFSYRYLDFFGARASVVGPSVLWQATERLAIDAQYGVVISQFSAVTESTTDQHALLRGSYRYRPRITTSVAYARGIENFDAVSIDRIGRFHANTLSGGVRVDFPTLTTLSGTYDYQWRPSDTSMQRLSLTIGQRF